MNTLSKPEISVTRFILLLLVVFNISACQEDDTVTQFLQSLPHEHPAEITRFQQADSVYFGHLGYNTIPRENGSFLLLARDPQILLLIDEKGKMQRRVAREGRGPGEILDIISMVQTEDGGALMYDQRNKKAIRLDGQMQYEHQFIPKSPESAGITGVYPTSRSDTYIVEVSPNDYIFDENKRPRRLLMRYNVESDSYEKSVTLKEKAFAQHIVDGQLAGGRYVPYAHDQLLSYNPETQTLLSFWTGAPNIAELSADFDTLNTIPVELPAQQLSSEERDSLKADERKQQWKTVSDALPDIKTPVSNMKRDEQGRIWLKLTYRRNSDRWLIMDEQGNPQKIVHLPKGSMLTHVSGQHLGVRLDDITFALFEPVE